MNSTRLPQSPPLQNFENREDLPVPMEVVKSIRRIQERVVERSSSNPSPEVRCVSRLERKEMKRLEKENSMKKRSINPILVSSIMLFQEEFKLKPTIQRHNNISHMR